MQYRYQSHKVASYHSKELRELLLKRHNHRAGTEISQGQGYLIQVTMVVINTLGEGQNIFSLFSVRLLVKFPQNMTYIILFQSRLVHSKALV